MMRQSWSSLISSSVIAALLSLLAVPESRILTVAQTIQIPSPEEAAKRAETLTPEEITQLEVDETIRDRLRFDPNWQPMLQAVRQDIMQLKWTERPLQNPVWKQYGPKVYPLLEFYSRSGDETRQRYAVAGIRSLGKPYTTIWLTKQIQQGNSPVYFYLVAENPVVLLNGEYNQSYNAKSWEQDFGLDDTAVRTKLIRLAKAKLGPRGSPTFNDQFTLGFLENLEGYDKIYPYQPDKPAPQLTEWSRWEKITQPSDRQILTAIAYYLNLPRESQEHLLVNHLGRVEAGKLYPIGKALLQHLAGDQQSKDWVWAIAELERHGDPQAQARLQQLINQDLRQLAFLTQLVGYERISPLESYTYFLLLGIAERYPQSRLIQGCREYGDLTGLSYFGGEPRSKAIRDRIAQQTPAERVRAWQQWLERYPDHPGADDATYFVAFHLQAQNDVLGAMRQWIKLMSQPIGDNDAPYLAYPHVRTLLDVGLTTDQIQTLLQEPESAPLAPLLQYSLAVRYARSQNYAQALQTAQGLDLRTLSDSVLGSYYNSAYWAWWDQPDLTREVRQQMQTMLTEQRQRWQQLLTWQKENTPAARYQIAADWAGIGGWKNGYLPVWDNARISLLPTSFYENERLLEWQSSRWDCRYWWACDRSRRDEATIRAMYQAASQNAVALSLYEGLLKDANTPASLREKTLYMVAMTLLHQWENYPLGETERIHPPVGVQAGPKKYDPDTSARNYDIARDYQQRIDSILSELQVRFPQSAYTDDLLFSSYYLSGQPRYLQQLLNQYPNSDRATEARFLLNQ